MSGAAGATEIIPDLFFIERGYLNGNHFVYRGEEPALIDTAYLSGYPETLATLKDLGVEPSRVGLVVNTHCHCDHVGGNRNIQEASGCPVALHPLGRRFMETGDDWATWWRYYDQEARFFRCTRTLEDGETLALGAHRFRVIHTPGHAADGLVLYHPEERLLFSSDTLWERDLAVVTPRVEGDDAPRAWLRSLERLASLEVRAVFPGHGPPFTDLSAALSRARARLEAYHEDPERMADDLLKKITVYTLLMRGPVPEAGVVDDLMATPWFPDTVDRYFGGEYRRKYSETREALLARGAVVRRSGRLLTTVKR